jgi:acyl-coenzyme A synthetase/AMP-(fatty) acid ligase
MSCWAAACGRSSALPALASPATRCLTTAAGDCPGYMVPDVVEFCEALPRTSTGKVDRAGLARHGT